jgi:uncharacterized protein (DUF433 family)/predicted nucleotidyltransferase
MDEQNPLERITSDPNLLNARLMIRDRQLSVAQVLGELAVGETFESLLVKYPGLETADIQACLVYAQKLVLQAEQARQPNSIVDLKAAIPQILEQIPYLKLLVLFGSRARGDNDSNSDWDFAFLCDEELRKQYEKPGWDCYRIWGILQRIYRLDDDQVDAVDIGEISDLLAHNVAKDGRIIYEREPGEFEQFKQRKLMNKDQLKALRQKQRESLQATLKELK